MRVRIVLFLAITKYGEGFLQPSPFVRRSSLVHLMAPTPEDQSESEQNSAAAEATIVSSSEPIDPKQAIAEIGNLAKEVQLVWTEGSTWSPEERVTRRRELVSSYVRVFAPAVAFSGVQLALTFVLLAFVLLLLAVSGRGYSDVAPVLGSIPLLGGLLEEIDPSLGNLAIGLLAVEVSAPVVLLPLSVALTPQATDALQRKLTKAGLDAEGLNRRIEEVLEKTTD